MMFLLIRRSGVTHYSIHSMVYQFGSSAAKNFPQLFHLEVTRFLRTHNDTQALISLFDKWLVKRCIICASW